MDTMIELRNGPEPGKLILRPITRIRSKGTIVYATAGKECVIDAKCLRSADGVDFGSVKNCVLRGWCREDSGILLITSILED